MTSYDNWKTTDPRDKERPEPDTETITVKVLADQLGSEQTREELQEELDVLGYGFPKVVTSLHWIYVLEVEEDSDWALDFDNMLAPECWFYCQGEELNPDKINL